MNDPLSIYVAAGSSEIVAARSAIAELRDYGFRVTYDWTADPGWATAIPGGADNRPKQEKTRSARADAFAIFDAATFWLMAPAVASRGAYTEQGIAMGVSMLGGSLRKRIIVSGPDASRDLFSAVADKVFDTHDQAFRYLRTLAQFSGVEPK